MAQHNRLGQEGEQMARDFLISHGYIVREVNWRMGHLEVDIIAEEPGARLLHIVEVKTRTNVEHFDPMKAVNAAKQRNLINAANGYVRYYQLRLGVQFDVMTPSCISS